LDGSAEEFDPEKPQTVHSVGSQRSEAEVKVKIGSQETEVKAVVQSEPEDTVRNEL
jgi:hypothetical protein